MITHKHPDPCAWVPYVLKRNGWLCLEEMAAKLGEIVRRRPAANIERRNTMLAARHGTQA